MIPYHERKHTVADRNSFFSSPSTKQSQTETSRSLSELVGFRLAHVYTHLSADSRWKHRQERDLYSFSRGTEYSTR